MARVASILSSAVIVLAALRADPAAAQSSTRQECTTVYDKRFVMNTDRMGGHYESVPITKCRTVAAPSSARSTSSRELPRRVMSPQATPRRLERAECATVTSRRWVKDSSSTGGHYDTVTERKCSAGPGRTDSIADARALRGEEEIKRVAALRAAAESSLAAVLASGRARGDAYRRTGSAAPLLAATPEASRAEIERRMLTVRHVLGIPFRDLGSATGEARHVPTENERLFRPEYAPDTIRDARFRFGMARGVERTIAMANVRFIWTHAAVLGESSSLPIIGRGANTDAVVSYHAVRCTPGNDTVEVAPAYADLGLAGGVVRGRQIASQAEMPYLRYVAKPLLARYQPLTFAIVTTACNDSLYHALPTLDAMTLAAAPMPVIFDSSVTMPMALPDTAGLVPVRVSGQRMQRRIGAARVDTLLDGSRLFWVVVQHDDIVSGAPGATCAPFADVDCAREYNAELRLERHRCLPSGDGNYGWGDSWFSPRLAARYLNGVRVAVARPAPYYADPSTGAGALVPTSAPAATRALQRWAGDIAEQGVGARAEICQALTTTTAPIVTPVLLTFVADQIPRTRK